MKGGHDLLSCRRFGEPWVLSFGVQDHLLKHLSMVAQSMLEPLFIFRPGFVQQPLLKHLFVMGIKEGMVSLTSNPHVR